MVKDYKNCYFAVGVDEKFIVKKKRGDSNWRWQRPLALFATWTVACALANTDGVV